MPEQITEDLALLDNDIASHWREIIDTMSDGLLVVGQDGTLRMVNRALSRLTGYEPGELIGRPCSVLNCDVCEIARTKGQGKWCLLFDRLRVGVKRCLIMRKDGGYVPVLKNASILRDASGAIIGAVETLTDISELDKRDQIIEQLSRQLDTDDGFHGLIGKSPIMQRLYQIIEKAAQSDAPVIILGESGTGKELVAKAVHELGRRKDGPFIQLNCAALNEALLESELFGHIKGAFTGAYRHREGRFEAAHGGDIFLDEIGDVPLPIQVKLLRVLETKRFERVGDHRPVSVDVRVITATNKDLRKLVAEGSYREDFLYRINVIPIHLPPLRERREDIPVLADHFIRRLSARSGKRITGLSPETLKVMMTYPFPGNVRELSSAIEYAFVISESGLIEPHQLPPHMSAPACGEPAAAAMQMRASSLDERSRQERASLLEALRRAGGNKSEAARLLGVNRVTVLNRMRKYGIDQKTVFSE